VSTAMFGLLIAPSTAPHSTVTDSPQHPDNAFCFVPAVLQLPSQAGTSQKSASKGTAGTPPPPKKRKQPEQQDEEEQQL